MNKLLEVCKGEVSNRCSMQIGIRCGFELQTCSVTKSPADPSVISSRSEMWLGLWTNPYKNAETIRTLKLSVTFLFVFSYTTILLLPTVDTFINISPKRSSSDFSDNSLPGSSIRTLHACAV